MKNYKSEEIKSCWIPLVCNTLTEEGIEAFRELQKYDSDYLWRRCKIHSMEDVEKMEFDKSRVLTCVTADQALVGQKGWFGETLCALEKRVKRDPPEVLERVLLSGDRRYIFMTNSDSWSLFYPAPEPSYAERQAEWVKENNVKEGTKVRVTRTFTENEDGSRCWKHDDLVGKTGIIRNIIPQNLWVDMSDRNVRTIPYFALEVIKEPTYRPYNSDELNNLVGKVVVRKCDGNKILVNGRISPIKVRLGNDCTYTAEQLLELFTLNDEPCGVREEA